MDRSPHPAARRTNRSLINRPAFRWFFCFILATLVILPSASATNLLLKSSFEDNTGSGGTASNWTNYGCVATESWANHTGNWGAAMCSWINSGNGAEYQEVVCPA